MGKRILSVLLALLMLLTLVPVGALAEGDAEYALFPGDILNVTQGAYGTYSHQNQNAFDIGSNSNYRAPFTGTITAINEKFNAVIFQSKYKVKWANGDYDYMSVCLAHDNDISDLIAYKEKGTVIKQGEIFYQPV